MIKFGTGGFRAIIGDEFTKANLELLAQGLVHKMQDEHVENTPLIIGYDRRFLSEQAAKWVAELFAANGVKVWFISGFPAYSPATTFMCSLSTSRLPLL